MKGIYLTEEGKQELESQIYALEEYKDSDICKDPRDWSFVSGKQAIIKEILSSAIILPIEENWYDVSKSVVFENIYPNGVVIQPK
jgi:hypothetical protein